MSSIRCGVSLLAVLVLAAGAAGSPQCHTTLCIVADGWEPAADGTAAKEFREC
eukprot:gene27904-62825_t